MSEGMAMEDGFKGWTCDECHEPILTAEQGYVEWLKAYEPATSGPSGRNLVLVHRKDFSPLTGSEYGCQYDNRVQHQAGYAVQSLPLDSFLGPDGLMLLLRFIHKDELLQEEVLEMTKRLHIPGYEHARLYLRDAISAGVCDPNTPIEYPYQYQIEEILLYAKGDRA